MDAFDRALRDIAGQAPGAGPVVTALGALAFGHRAFRRGRRAGTQGSAGLSWGAGSDRLARPNRNAPRPSASASWSCRSRGSRSSCSTRPATTAPGTRASSITDLVMPGMSGRDLAERVVAERPRVTVLFTSAYSSDEVVRRGLLPSEASYLQKPFTLESLATAVRELLRQPAD